MTSLKVLVTGANGFVGRALCVRAAAHLLTVQPATRVATYISGVGPSVAVGTVDDTTRWKDALEGCNAVVHLAARAHIVKEFAADPSFEFYRTNVQGTINLAQQAAVAGVNRFVFVSTIGVNGAETFGTPFGPNAIVSPHSPYAISKYKAELGLLAVAMQTGMEVVIIRPPLVYGPNAPGNFGSLMSWLRSGVPLPLGAINNQRSLVALDNLIDLIVMCLTHPAAANQTFMVSDGEDVSTTELLLRMGQAMGKPARLLPLPASWLKLAAALVGKPDLAQRLCGSLQVDISKTRELLGWVPPVSLDEGLRRAASGLGLPSFARNDGKGV